MDTALKQSKTNWEWVKLKTSPANENVEMSSKLSYLQKYLSSGESIKTADGGEIKKKKKKKDKKGRGDGFKVQEISSSLGSIKVVYRVQYVFLWQM